MHPSHAVALATTKKNDYSEPTTRTSLNGGYAHPTFTHFLPQPLQKHGLCIVGQSQGEQFNVQELKEVIAEAVGDEDVARLAGLANTPAVRLVANRAAIQITGCDGETIVGHFPVDRYLLSAVEATAAELADSDDS